MSKNQLIDNITNQLKAINDITDFDLVKKAIKNSDYASLNKVVEKFVVHIGPNSQEALNLDEHKVQQLARSIARSTVSLSQNHPFIQKAIQLLGNGNIDEEQSIKEALIPKFFPVILNSAVKHFCQTELTTFNAQDSTNIAYDVLDYLKLHEKELKFSQSLKPEFLLASFAQQNFPNNDLRHKDKYLAFTCSLIAKIVGKKNTSIFHQDIMKGALPGQAISAIHNAALHLARTNNITTKQAQMLGKLIGKLVRNSMQDKDELTSEFVLDKAQIILKNHHTKITAPHTPVSIKIRNRAKINPITPD